MGRQLRTGLHQHLVAAGTGGIIEDSGKIRGDDRIKATLARGFQIGGGHAAAAIKDVEAPALANMVRQVAHGELRIIRKDRAGTGDDGVGAAAQRMGKQQ